MSDKQFRFLAVLAIFSNFLAVAVGSSFVLSNKCWCVRFSGPVRAVWVVSAFLFFTLGG